VAPSVGNRCDAHDNALDESFLSTLDREMLYGKIFLTRAAHECHYSNASKAGSTATAGTPRWECFRRPNSSAVGALS
jgi:hypothetical protein